MTQPAHTPDPHPSAAPAPPPDEVLQAAASRQFGRLVAGQRGSNPFGNLAFGLGGGIALIAGGILLAWLGSLIDFRPLALLGCPLMVVGVVVLGYALAALFAGFTATYLFEQGLVHTKNKKLDAVAWSEVDQLWLWKAGGNNALTGKLLCYYVVTFDGRKVPVEVAVAKGEQPLGPQLEQIVAQLGRPVVDSGPLVGKMRP
ncbi:hypothetical protein BJY16_008676 [Actinoplanes octamycinicus]|uniref:Uncharacterized protein n=1 Tax=Actinoplanes octamycinicus TaxID=135948 RepID=A0A7W7MCJ5_9ACTN|nr:DUF6585 family protein [Actinoplanes octamycinicus]MBB4745217.1 hypothetical protein [Actinoplanes octamycinicus]GIE62656.1 hypothetical protein Aoc01nite_80580 [Actinoplanes octamycinicus]